MDILDEMKENLIQGKEDEVVSLTKKALNEGINPEEILNKGLISGMEVIGKKFQNNEIYVPEMLIAARAMKSSMGVLKPLLVDTGVEPIGKVVIGTVKGDLHDIGKNLVAMMLEGGGFEVTDAGYDVSPDKFVELIKSSGANILGMSALLTTTMTQMKNTIEVFIDKGLRKGVKIVIGGAPVDSEYAKKIGADGYAPDAAGAVDLVKSLVK